MSIFEYNGSAIVAMVGKNCFAIASDRRLGVNLQTVATDFQRIFKIHDKLFVGLSGLGSDAQTLGLFSVTSCTSCEKKGT
uniref:Proteasome subunit beta n=1 Tax=Salix viminalis TaxID=40686 RepID=A0A6N2LW78_SALVM